MRVLCAAAIAGVVSGASGQVLEGFEHGNEGLYGFAWSTNDNLSLTGAAARSGVLGAEFSAVTTPAWRTRFDVATSPGHTYFAHARIRAGTGRAYLGVAADSGGCWSAVLAPNTSEVELQTNLAYGFETVAAAPATYTVGTWYVIRLEWAADGMMTASVWDDAQTTQVAAT